MLQVIVPSTTRPTVEHTIRQSITQHAYSGAAIVVGNADSVTYSKGFGYANWSKTDSINPDSSIYDLASLTKVVATTSAIMYLQQRGYIQLDDHVDWYIPEFDGKYKDEVTIRQLLTHTSGMRSGMYLGKYNTPEEAKMAVIQSHLYCKPGRCYNYSDLGMIILGIVVERITQQPFDTFVQDSIFIPLGMTHTTFRPSSVHCDWVVATHTEHNECGLVNDENSQALGGVAGHAGLFSTAEDLSIFAKMMLNYGRVDTVQFFDSSTIALFTTEVSNKRALGWAVYKKTNGNVIGHMGWTGTMMLLDMENKIYVIVLTNRAINNNRHSSFASLDRMRDTMATTFIPNFSLVKKSRRHVPKKKNIKPTTPFGMSATLAAIVTLDRLVIK